MAMVSCMDAGREVEDGMHAGQSHGVGSMSGDAEALPNCGVIH